MWVIPDTTRWTLIFNRAARVFHTLRNYNEQEDALRVTAMVDSLPHMETLTASFPTVDARKAVLRLQWGTTAVSVHLETR